VIERHRCRHTAEPQQASQELPPVAGRRQTSRERVETPIVHGSPFTLIIFCFGLCRIRY
jgi:hypothetical protein